jgi:hypothetical protein
VRYSEVASRAVSSTNIEASAYCRGLRVSVEPEPGAAGAGDHQSVTNGALFNRMAPVLWVIAVLSTLTVIHRMRYTWTRTQDAAAKAGQAA